MAPLASGMCALHGERQPTSTEPALFLPHGASPDSLRHGHDIATHLLVRSLRWRPPTWNFSGHVFLAFVVWPPTEGNRVFEDEVVDTAVVAAAEGKLLDDDLSLALVWCTSNTRVCPVQPLRTLPVVSNFLDMARRSQLGDCSGPVTRTTPKSSCGVTCPHKLTASGWSRRNKKSKRESSTSFGSEQCCKEVWSPLGALVDTRPSITRDLTPKA